MDGLEFDLWQGQEMFHTSLSRMVVQFHWYKGFPLWVEHQGTKVVNFLLSSTEIMNDRSCASTHSVCLHDTNRNNCTFSF